MSRLPLKSKQMLVNVNWDLEHIQNPRVHQICPLTFYGKLTFKSIFHFGQHFTKNLKGSFRMGMEGQKSAVVSKHGLVGSSAKPRNFLSRVTGAKNMYFLGPET